MYEGEVTELTPTESENPLSGYGKTVSHVIVGLKTVKGTKQLRLDPSIYEAILKEKIVVGDVVYVEQNTGAVKVRCEYPGLGVLNTDTELACRTLGCLRLIIRSRIRNIRSPSQRRRTQAKRTCPRRNLRRSRCSQCSTPRWTGHHERDGQPRKERTN